MRDAPPLSLNKLDLDLLSPTWKSLFKQHRLAITATPSIGTKQPIKLMSEFFGGDVSKLKDWYGDLSIRLTDAHIPDFKAWLDYPIQVQSAKGDATLHLDFDHLKAQKALAFLDLSKIKFKLNAKQKALNFDQLKGKLTWRHNVDQVSLNLENVDLKQKDLVLNKVNATYTKKTGEGVNNQNVVFKLKALNLTRIDSILDAFPIKPDGLETLTKLSPKGQLENLTIAWEGNASKTTSLNVTSTFKNLELTAYQKVPGFQNLAGSLNATHKGGTVTLNTNNASLNFEKVLRQVIPNNSIKGTIAWSIKKNQKKITLNKVSINNPHLNGTLNGSLLLGIPHPTIDLTGAFSNVQVPAAHYYFPTFLSERTLHWLDNAFIAGTGEAVNLTLKGRLSDFPYMDENNALDLKKGLFRITSKVNNGEVHYGNNWPNIQNIQLDMLFEGNRMVLSNSSGDILGNHIDQATITIPALRSPDPMLNVSGVTRGPVRAGILFINQSPVSKVTQGFTDNLTTAGQGALNLTLDIPLKHAADTQIKGAYQFTDAMMASAIIPEIKDINGRLDFTQASLNANQVNATAFDTPIVVDLTSGQDKSISIDVEGRVNNALLKHFVNNPEHYLSGTSPLTGNILVKKPNVNMTLRSNLTGVTSYMPAPFNKPAEEPLNLLIEKIQTPTTDTMNFHIGQLFTAEILSKRSNDKTVMETVNLHFDERNTNGISNPFSNKPAITTGINLTGNLDYTNVDAWQDAIKDLLPADDKTAQLQLNHLKLEVNQLDIFKRRLNNVTVDRALKENGFLAIISSKELTGDLHWKDQGNGQLIANLTHLSLPEKAPIAVDTNPLYTKPVDESAAQKNENYPAITINSKSFIFKGKNVGALELAASPNNDSWMIEKLKLINPDSTLSAKGLWKDIDQNPTTQLDIDWDIDNLGKTLDRLGYPGTLARGKGDLKGQINWAGSPHEFDALALNGQLKFDIRKGEILKVKPGVGRLLGLVSLQSLPRRLTLDFRDLFSNGFAFDKIKSRIAIKNGIMRTDNFKMAGPAADVEIKGETNLKAETQHLFVKVLPQISDTLSLAALAGGPLAGAVAFLAQKVLKDPLNKIISTQYEIVGTWDKPVEVKSDEEAPNSISNVIQ
jgi:uncharacterized protein (TIGR02099 family)